MLLIVGAVGVVVGGSAPDGDWRLELALEAFLGVRSMEECPKDGLDASLIVTDKGRGGKQDWTMVQ